MGAASSCVRRRMDARGARPCDIEIGLLRVELDDELFLDRETDVFALGKVRDRAAELIGLELEPLGNAASGGRFDGLADLIVLAALFPDLDHVALADLIGRSEEHTSELQSPCNLVCRLLLETKNIANT